MGRLAAFLDEADVEPSKGRAGVYVVAAAVVELERSMVLRSFLRSLVRPEDAEPKHDFARLHVARIKDKRRKSEIIATLGMLRHVTFVVGCAKGYRRTVDREPVRRAVMTDMLPWLAKSGVESTLIELRDTKSLQVADARTVAALRTADLLSPQMAVRQGLPSEEPLLWIADACAAAWRRAMAEGKTNWSQWYEPHTALIDVPFTGRRGE
ncbi:hypothetical protein [Microtetraspora malaysiensis]|uniref:hypothetical protein n=1 Tax=Microtetraspora malaysiensis TaxID=161358 RepID=UPI003D91BAFD